MGKLVGEQLSKYLGVCLPGASGDIINQLGGVDLSAINNLTSVVNSINSFQASTLQTGVETVLNGLDSMIDQYYYTDLYDFDTNAASSDVAFMRNIGNPTNYAGCTVNSFTQDSWIPSTRQSMIACSVTTSTASSTECPSSTEISGGRGSSASCFGCMDSMKVLLNSGTNQAVDLNNRYNDAGCTTWKTEMTSLWTNYYDIKKTNYPPVRTRMATAKSTYNTATSGYHDKLTDCQTAFVPISSQLTSIVRSVVDPQYGMVVGLNCLVLGEDINLISNTTCVRLFNTFYFLRLALGLAAFGILFTLCCATCTGVRAFKHS